MRLGVDFGTTRIIVAAVDRGNYPLVNFEGHEGEPRDWFPPFIAARGSNLLYGWEAWSAQTDPKATVVRSIKRLLREAGPGTLIEIAGQQASLLEVLTGLASALRTALSTHSNLHRAGTEPFKIMLGIPANANSNQRFLTTEAFRRAGFVVLGLLNEPSAASIEFGHASRGKRREEDARSVMLIYDLGGGTFDASLMEMDAHAHTVIASEGLPALGGDDFDDILAELVLESAGFGELEHDSLSPADLFWLHEECRQKKEALRANTKQIVVDLDVAVPGCEPVAIPLAAYYERCRPLVDETIRAVERLLSKCDAPLDALYVTGGGSELPLVSRTLKEVFGARARRSAYTRAATAIGLAIQADQQAGYQLREKFTRHFGVWREGNQGLDVIFDPLFPKGTPLPAPGDPPLRVTRRYHPAHNIGHFRYLECGSCSEDGQPTGDISVWDEILFPFDPDLRDQQNLTPRAVVRSDKAFEQEIEETYLCDVSGSVTVRIANTRAGFERSYQIAQWAALAPSIVAGRRRRMSADDKPTLSLSVR
jgi:molecular chaperone DnaK (HSP70)